MKLPQKIVSAIATERLLGQNPYGIGVWRGSRSPYNRQRPSTSVFSGWGCPMFRFDWLLKSTSDEWGKDGEASRIFQNIFQNTVPVLHRDSLLMIGICAWDNPHVIPHIKHAYRRKRISRIELFRNDRAISLDGIILQFLPGEYGEQSTLELLVENGITLADLRKSQK